MKTTGGIYPAGDNEPPIAPGNTRERLRIICGEKTQIAPRTGSGTVATISIPKTENKQRNKRQQIKQIKKFNFYTGGKNHA